MEVWKRNKKSWIALLLSMCMLCTGIQNWAKEIEKGSGNEVTTKQVDAEEYPYLPLYAKGAVLIDGDSGRILYAKNAQNIMPMASTTKIMTCIVALEYGNMDDYVAFSSYAASQPKVHLGAKVGRKFLLKDLLHSLMLESHNDTAVAIAEHIGGQIITAQNMAKDGEAIDSKQAVETFVNLMNQKAAELDLKNTFFVTPNGLDGSKEVEEENGKVLKRHSTTAYELAKMMQYCVFESPKKDDFLAITRQQNYAFWDKEGVICYSCTNHNNLLNQMSQALSGKTGFTNAAGYCYVGALVEKDKKFVLALLACGWPNNKNYKWSDCKELFAYGDEFYEYKAFCPEVKLQEICIRNGKTLDLSPYSNRYIVPTKEGGEELEKMVFTMLAMEGEEILARVNQQLYLSAPIEKNTLVGEIEYYLKDRKGNEKVLQRIPLFVNEKVEEIDFGFVLHYVLGKYLIWGKK